MLSLPANMKVLLILAESSWKQKLNFSRRALFYMKTRVSLEYFCELLSLEAFFWF